MRRRFQVGILQIMPVSKRYLSHGRRSKPCYIEEGPWESVFTPSKMSGMDLPFWTSQKWSVPLTMVDGTHLPC